jgi:hypothetical protein
MKVSNEVMEKIDKWVNTLSKRGLLELKKVVELLTTVGEMDNKKGLMYIPYDTLDKGGVGQEVQEEVLLQLWRLDIIELFDIAEGNCISSWNRDYERDNFFTPKGTFVDIYTPGFEYLYKGLFKKKRNNGKPEALYKVPGLFVLSVNPTAVKYAGQRKIPKEWANTRGKTQVWAILKLVFDKYNINTNRSDRNNERVTLSLSDIKKVVDNKKSCNKPTDWEASLTKKRRLDYFKSNILKKVPFAENELHVTFGEVPHLVFELRVTEPSYS